jgi:hypothetical protein
MIRPLVFGAVVVLGAACRSGDEAPAAALSPDRPGPVTLALDRAAYRPGDEVRLTLSNAGAARYWFNPCTRALERRVEGGWQPAEPDRICTMEAWELAAHATVSATTTLPTSAPAGEYRFVVSLTQDGSAPGTGRVDAVSRPFAVRS